MNSWIENKRLLRDWFIEVLVFQPQFLFFFINMAGIQETSINKNVIHKENEHSIFSLVRDWVHFQITFLFKRSESKRLLKSQETFTKEPIQSSLGSWLVNVSHFFNPKCCFHRSIWDCNNSWSYSWLLFPYLFIQLLFKSQLLTGNYYQKREFYQRDLMKSLVAVTKRKRRLPTFHFSLKKSSLFCNTLLPYNLLFIKGNKREDWEKCIMNSILFNKSELCCRRILGSLWPAAHTFKRIEFWKMFTKRLNQSLTSRSSRSSGPSQRSIS